MRLYNYPNSLLFFTRYSWYLRALNSKQAELRKVLADINSGLISRDTLDENWRNTLENEAEELKTTMKRIEFAIESIPETPSLLPCKLFMRLHFICGMNMTEVAEKLNVSLTTLRRIRDRAARHFDAFPPTCQ